MAGFFDDLPTDPNRLGATGLSFYDADTLYDADGKGYRLTGVNAPEVGAIKDGEWSEGDVGGNYTTEQVVKLANELGYTNVVKLGKRDSTDSREMIDLQDEQGRSFTRELAASGAMQILPEFDRGGSYINSYEYKQAMGSRDGYEPDEFDQVADLIQQNILEDSKYTQQFKQMRLMPGMQGEGIAEEGAVFSRAGVNDKLGDAKNPLSTAWNTAMKGVSEGLWGMVSLIGEKTGIDYLQEAGESGVYRKRAEIGEFGKILTDYKDVHSFSTAMQYVGNNAAMSLPYMAITAVAAMASPVTGGASLSVPASIYAGQTWNEMGDQAGREEGDRSASIAIASGVVQAALDRFGIEAIVKAGHPKEIFKSAVAQLAKAKNISEKVAEETLADATRKELGYLLKQAGQLTKDQINGKMMTMQTLKRMGVGAAGEAGTEALQEATGAIAADLGSTGVVDWTDVSDRMIQGFVAGGVLGGGFSAAAGIHESGQWANMLWGKSLEDPSGTTREARFAREEESNRGYVPSNNQNMEEVNNLPDPFDSVQDRKERHKQDSSQRSMRDVFVDTLMASPKLWRGSVRYIFTPEVLEQSRAARVLASAYNGTLGRIFGGSTYESRKHQLVTEYKHMLQDEPHNIWIEMNEGMEPSYDRKMELSDEFYNEAAAAIDLKTGKLNRDMFTGTPQVRAAKLKLVDNLQKLADKMYDDQAKHNKDLGKIHNYLLRYRALNNKAVAQNRDAFIKLLKDNYNYLSQADAERITDDIISGNSGTAQEAFSVIKGGPQPGSHKGRTLNLSDNKAFDKFMERNLMTNLSKSAKSAARYIANQEFVGDNASKVAKLLDQMERDGVDRKTVDKIAAQFTDYLDAESGNYHRPTSEAGRIFQAVQKNFMLAVVVTALPLSTISSFVELALGSRGLTQDQIFGKDGLMKTMGKELGSMLWNGMKEIGGLGADAVPVKTKGRKVERTTKGQQLVHDAGFYDWEVGAATTTGVTETHEWHQRILESFFKWVGLQGWTNTTRAIRAAMIGDYIVDNAQTILAWQQQNEMMGEPRTNEVREAEDKLRNLGLDVSKGGILQKMVDSINGKTDPTMEAEISAAMKEALYNFINEAVTMPTPSNRPLMYQDPRLALFMQFQGFMSAFTANTIPRLWGEYIRRGSPQMRYNTFAMMVTMIGLGFASQYLKDLIKYGGKNPHLDTEQVIQRGIRASGLLGTGERVLDQFFPLYETRTNGPSEWLFDTAVTESPALSKAKLLGGAAADTIGGDYDRAASTMGKAILGPVKNPAGWAWDEGMDLLGD